MRLAVRLAACSVLAGSALVLTGGSLAQAQEAGAVTPAGATPPAGNAGGTAQNPGQAAPGQAAPGQATPGQATPGQATPGQATPGQATQNPTQNPTPNPVPPPSGTVPGPSGQDPASGRMVLDPATNTIAFSMNESNGMELTEFIKWAEQVTGKRFTWSSQDINNAAPSGNTVSFLGTFRIKRERLKEDFDSFFQTMLYIKGFAVVPRGEGDLEMFEIVSMGGQRAREVTNGARYVTPDELPAYRNKTGVPILTTVPLKNINATIATNALRPFFATTGAPTGGGTLTLGNVGNNSAMLLQGFGPQVYAAVELLKLVDLPTEQPNLTVQVVVLDQQAPEELEPILTEVLESRQRIRQQVLQENNAGSPGAVAGGSGQPQLKVVVHSSQRALVLSGTQEQVREALDLVARLDVPGEVLAGQASVMNLKNVLAKDLRETLNQFLQEDSNAETQAASAGGGAAGGAGAAAARRTRRTVIQAHEESNSLVVSAAGTKWQQIQKLIDKLDRRQPQVLIEAALVELTTGDLDRFGVELGLIDLKDDGDFTRGFGFTSFGQSVFEDTDDDGLPDTRLPNFENPLQGITGGIISGGDFAVPLLINALSTDDRANILSLPSVLVNNNESATVRTTESRPTQTQNQGTATTQSGVGAPREAGITLEISPTISPNNYLRLNINLEVSRFVGAFDPNSVTGGGITLSRAISTQVTMPSNSTMVIGGVIEDSESQSNGGIPLLKDIPLLGFLFRRSEDTSNKTNLYFFVTPTILDEDDFQDLFSLSLQKKLEAKDYIGDRRLRIIDKRWSDKDGQARTLEDAGSTLEDIDAQGENEMPTWRRRSSQPRDLPAAREPNAPNAPGGSSAGTQGSNGR
jgi:general secretion pathway protein D